MRGWHAQIDIDPTFMIKANKGVIEKKKEKDGLLHLCF